ncbi:MAG: DUF2283 domain-containing protein [Patescibacteria group bacterium]
MSKQQRKISYDRGSEVLSLAVGKGKSVDSDIRGNVVIDVDKKGNPVRIDIHGFSFDTFREGKGKLEHFLGSKAKVVQLK